MLCNVCYLLAIKSISLIVLHAISFLQDVNSATNVHHNLKGAVIPSSGSVGMRIQYPYTSVLKVFLCACFCHCALPSFSTAFFLT